jgi:uncharacterized lipoprotein YajG
VEEKMKNFKILILLVIALFFATACTPMAEEVMSPLQYKKPVAFKVDKNADLSWQSGKENTSMQAINVSGNTGLLGAVVTSSIGEAERQHNPARYTMRYGAAQEVVFMTSLKNILEKNLVFRRTEITTEPQKVNPQDVLIDINFKNSSVKGFDTNYQIALDVDMTITTKGKPAFARNYKVESSATGFFSFNSFKDHQAQVSQKLLDAVMADIEKWSE